MDADIVELLSSSEEEEDEGSKSSDAKKARELWLLTGAAQGQVKAALRAADGDVQAAANIILDATSEDVTRFEDNDRLNRDNIAGKERVVNAQPPAQSPHVAPRQDPLRTVFPVRRGIPATPAFIGGGQAEQTVVKREKRPLSMPAYPDGIDKPDSNCDDQDCVVDEHPPAKRASLAGTQSFTTSMQSSELGDDVMVTDGYDPRDELPHARFNCGIYSFESATDSTRRQVSTQNQLYCQNCFCFVCDVAASKCTKWRTHCMAVETEPWKKLRAMRSSRSGLVSGGKLPSSFLQKLPRGPEPVPPCPPAGYCRRSGGPMGLPVTDGAAGWPRCAGCIDFLMPRCVMHSHDSIPHNANIEDFFCLSGQRGDMNEDTGFVRNSNSEYAPNRTLVRDLASLQSDGFVQLSWKVRHVDKHMPATVKQKVDALVKKLPYTFDLQRKWTPNGFYRHPEKTFDDRFAQAEGNNDWWLHICNLSCWTSACGSQPSYHLNRNRMHAVCHPPNGPDSELSEYFHKVLEGPHTPSSCCGLMCTVHFEKSISQNFNSSSGDSRQNTASALRNVIQALQLPDFGSPSPSVQITPGTHISTAGLVKSFLKSKEWAKVEATCTEALALPVRQRERGDAGKTARRRYFLDRGLARLHQENLDGALHDAATILSSDMKNAEALQIYGQALLVKQQTDNDIVSVAKLQQLRNAYHFIFSAFTLSKATMNSELGAALQKSKKALHASAVETTGTTSYTISNLMRASSTGCHKSGTIDLFWVVPDTASTPEQIAALKPETQLLHKSRDRQRLDIHFSSPKFKKLSISDDDHYQQCTIVLVPKSSPPTVMKASACRRRARLPAQHDTVVSVYAYDRTGTKTEHDTREMTAEQIGTIINHSNAVTIVFQKLQHGRHRYICTMEEFSCPEYLQKDFYTPPKVKLNTVVGTKLIACHYGSLDSLWECTIDGVDDTIFVTPCGEDSSSAKFDAAFKRVQHIVENFLDTTCCNTAALCGTEAELVQHHCKAFTLKRLKQSSKFRDLRVLQDSPLFGLSKSYMMDGQKRELQQRPPGLTVSLRNYQRQTVQWLLDKEGQQSISDHFWVPLPVTPSPFQRAGVSVQPDDAYLYYCHAIGQLSDRPPEKCVGGIVAEEMGLGKTVEIISLLSLTIRASRNWQASCDNNTTRGGTLIVCPVSLFGQWKAELTSKLNSDSQFTIYGYHSGRSFDKTVIAGHDVVLTTFSILNREQNGIQKHFDLPHLISPLKDIEWYRVVLDEVHSIKTHNSQQTKYCLELKSSRRWAVTGTVMQTQIGDIAPILQFLRLSPLGDRYLWNRFCGANCLMKGTRSDPNRHTRDVNAPNPLALLSVTMQQIVMRHTKTQMFEGQPILTLPSRTQTVRMLEFDSTEQAVHDELERKALNVYHSIPERNFGKESLRLMSALLPLRMLASSPCCVSSEQLSEPMDFNDGETASQQCTREHIEKVLMKKGTDPTRVKSVLDELSGSVVITCAVCLDVLDSPAATDCGHTFCLECIKSVIHGDSNRTSGPCPICRKTVQENDILQLKLPSAVPREAAQAASSLGNLLQVCHAGIGSKIKALLESLKDMTRRDSQEKAVVFTQFSSTHAAIVKALKSHSIGVVQIHGAMTQRARTRSLERFISDPRITVFALSLRSGAVGLTLTAASRCYLMEPCLNEGTELQAVNRIHRLGQTKQVHTVTFVMNNSVEQRLLQLRKERAIEAKNAGCSDATLERSAGGVEDQQSNAAASGPTQRVRTNQMTNFTASRQKLHAQVDEWKLLFGIRASSAVIEADEPLPRATATEN